MKSIAAAEKLPEQMSARPAARRIDCGRLGGLSLAQQATGNT